MPPTSRNGGLRPVPASVAPSRARRGDRRVSIFEIGAASRPISPVRPTSRTWARDLGPGSRPTTMPEVSPIGPPSREVHRTMIAEGQPAPDFTLPDQDGNAVTLSGLKGSPSSSTSTPRTTPPAARPRPAPSATPGPTTRRPARRSLGVSPDDVKSHAKFAAQARPGLPAPGRRRDEGLRRRTASGRRRRCTAGRTWASSETTFVIDRGGRRPEGLPQGQGRRPLRAPCSTRSRRWADSSGGSADLAGVLDRRRRPAGRGRRGGRPGGVRACGGPCTSRR